MASEFLPATLSREWHPTKNYPLGPSAIKSGSNRVVWWQCDEGHEWEARVANRVFKGNSCPYCSGRLPILGENDLQTTHPFVDKWWSRRNKNPASAYLAGSGVKILWECPNGHEFTQAIRDFLHKRGERCSECRQSSSAVSKLLPKTILDSWDTQRNAASLEEVTIGSSSLFYWRCSKGHSWSSTVANRVKSKGCPVCSGARFVQGINDLRTKYPTLSLLWHPTKNGELAPETIPANSKETYYWKLACGHDVGTSIRTLRKNLQPCPICNNRLISPGINDLKTLNPELAKEWNLLKNTSGPEMFAPKSGKIVWWMCPKGHEWQTSILNRSVGTGCPFCSNKSILSGYNDLATLEPLLSSEWSSENNLRPSEVSIQSSFLAKWVCANGHSWEAYVYNRTGSNRTGCPFCWANTFVSSGEQELADFISSLNLKIQQSNRSLIGKELDIYIPSKKVAIEYNGLYWHSEKAGKTRTYHHDKWVKCKAKGIQLIQVWEDEWNRNPEQVKRMLAHKLGVSVQGKVFARSTVVAAVGKGEAEEFLSENHVQGFASGSYYVGLRAKDTGLLIALMVLKKEAGSGGKVLNIIRYATAANVVGGFTKLLVFAERTYQPESFITFADHCVSDGGLYERYGFVADKELPPDYMYVVRSERQHKFGYRLKRFKNDPELDWVEGLTERELADLNGLDRIWDAGKTRYRKAL